MEQDKKQLKIGSVTLDGNIVFAPIAGYSDNGFRSLCARYGAAMCYTEMVSAQGLYYDNQRSGVYLNKEQDEKYSAAQIFGCKPEFIERAVNMPVFEKFDVIDINAGCPVRKIYSNGEGSALLENIPAAVAVVKAALKNPFKKPVTIKMRTGIYDNSLALDFATAMEDAGVSAITVHGRTRKQGYSGVVDLDTIAAVKNKVKCTVIGNGDVTDKASLEKMLSTGVDGVMIARGALGKPYVFSALQDKPYEFNAKEAILYHIECLRKIYDDKTVTNLIKKHIVFYASGRRNVKELKTEINSSICLERVFEIVNKYF